MGVSSSELHDLTAFYEMLTASFGVLSQNTGFHPSLDRIVETMLGPLNLGPGGGSYNEPISHLHQTLEEHPTEEQSHSTPGSAPVSRTSPTNSREILQQLVQALTLLGRAPPMSTPLTPSPTPTTCIRSPDAFDGSNPDDLRPFLLQCQLTFNLYPQHYTSNSLKVFFMISYLKKSALEWFKIEVMEIDPILALSCRSNCPD